MKAIERYEPASVGLQRVSEHLFKHAGYPLTLLDFCASVSMLDEEGTLWVSFANDSTHSMTVDGLWHPHAPCQEFLASGLYTARSDIKAILHVHSSALESFALCGVVPNTKTLDQVFNVCGLPVLLEYAMTLNDLRASLQNVFRQPLARCALTVGNGVFCVGKSLNDAFAVFETLDFGARMILRASRVGTPVSLTDEQLAYHRFLASVSSFDEDTFAYRGISSLEKHLRAQMIQCLQKGISKGLMSSTGGAISVRLSPNSILITPTGMDRRLIEAHDLLLVRQDISKESYSIVHWYQEHQDLVPSRAVKAHFAIYDRHPFVQAIMSSHPLNVAAFCSIRSGLESRYMPPPYSNLARVLPLGYDECLDAERVASSFDETDQGAVGSLLVANDGAITIGDSLEKALERLEVLESVCSIAIDAFSLGCRDYSMFLPLVK